MDEPQSEETPCTVRDVTIRLLRSLGMTTIFGNPGSTELPFFRHWPADFRYILGLQEASVVAMAAKPSRRILEMTVDEQPCHIRTILTFGYDFVNSAVNVTLFDNAFNRPINSRRSGRVAALSFDSNDG